MDRGGQPAVSTRRVRLRPPPDPPKHQDQCGQIGASCRPQRGEEKGPDGRAERRTDTQHGPSGALMHSTGITVNNTVFYASKLLRDWILSVLTTKKL